MSRSNNAACSFLSLGGGPRITAQQHFYPRAWIKQIFVERPSPACQHPFQSLHAVCESLNPSLPAWRRWYRLLLRPKLLERILYEGEWYLAEGFHLDDVRFVLVRRPVEERFALANEMPGSVIWPYPRASNH